MTTSDLSPSGTATPTPPAERLLAPDLARGIMLLLIALAHSRMLHAGGNSYAAPAGGGPLDVAVQAVLTSLVDGRAAPLFGLLFGYGLVQITRRQSDAGRDPAGVRRLIRRRGAWLVVFGVAHIVLLYAGDVIAAYGLAAVALAGAVSWSGRRLWSVAAAALLLGSAVLAAIQVAGGDRPPLPVGPTLLDGVLLRTSALPVLPLAAASVVAPVLVGIWAGRRRLLEQPDRYRVLLRRVALAGLPVAVLGALPVTLQAVGAWSPESATVEAAAYVLFGTTGVAGGFAYAALIALVAARIGARRGRVTTALVACGRRSMTFYIAQSPVWLVATEPSLLGPGGRLGAAAAAGVGVATWLVTVVIADMLRRGGRRGPAETLIRRLTYGRRARDAEPAPPGPHDRS